MRSHDLDFPYCAFHIRFRFESLVNCLPLRKTSQKPTLVNLELFIKTTCYGLLIETKKPAKTFPYVTNSMWNVLHCAINLI